MKDKETTIGGFMAAIGYVLTKVDCAHYCLPLWVNVVGMCMVAGGLALMGIFATQVKSFLGKVSGEKKIP